MYGFVDFFYINYSPREIMVRDLSEEEVYLTNFVQLGAY